MCPGILSGQETRKADKWFEGGAYYKALEEYCRIIAEASGNLRQADIEFKAGVCCVRMNRYTHAQEWLTRAERNGYMGKALYEMLGNVYLIDGDYIKAKQYFERYKELVPEDKRTDNWIASCDFGMTASTENTEVTIEALPYINTRGSEYGISFISGGLLYSSTGDLLPEKKNEVSQRTGMGFSKPYLSVLRNGEYQPGQLLKGIQRAGANEGTFSYDVVNDQLYCTRCEQDIMNCQIFLARLKGHNFRQTGVLKMAGKSYNIAHPFVAEGGNRIYFSSTIEGGYGGSDIWYVDRTANGHWGRPQNAGSAINTPGNEVFPYIWKEWFFFASDGHVGYGGLDIYKIRFQEREHGQPQNMGAGFNTSYDDFNLIMHTDGKGGLLVSNRTAGRSDDIYRFEIGKSVAESILDKQPEYYPPVYMKKEKTEVADQKKDAEVIEANREIELKDDSEGIQKSYWMKVEKGDVRDTGWWVQVAMLMESKVIKYDLASRITGLTGRNIVMYKGEDGGHRFYVGVYAAEQDARNVVAILKNAGIDCFIKRVSEK